MVLDDLLDLALNFWCDLARRDLGEERSLGGSERLTELGLPAGDLVDGDGVQLDVVMRRQYHRRNKVDTYETVDTSVDDGDLDLHGHGLVLTLLCKMISNRSIV